VRAFENSSMAEALFGACFKPSTRFPCCSACCSLALFIAVIVVGMLLRFPEVNTNFNDFMKTDVESSRMHDALLAALDWRDPSGPSDDRRRLVDALNITILEGDDSLWEGHTVTDELVPEDSTNGSRRLTGLPLFKQFDLLVAYELNPKSGNRNLFDESVVTKIAELEKRLLSLPSWSHFCAEFEGFNFMGLCNPGLSFSNYALPTMDIATGGVIPSMFTFNKEGIDMLPLEIMFRMTELHQLNRIMLPEAVSEAAPETLSESPSSVLEIRTAFRFKQFCCYSTDTATYQLSTVRRQKEEWETFLKDEVLPVLQEPIPESWDDEDKYPLRIWYTGDSVESIEVMQTLLDDLKLAIGSMLFVLGYMVFHTRSFFLSICGLITIFLSVPVSYVVFALIAESNQMSIASFLSVFLVIGLGADVVFVYTDFWRDSESISKNQAVRMEWTYRHAAKASFATTSTTAISFLANLASVLRSLREFGTFMGLCVMFVWIIVSLIYVPMCAFDDRYLSRCRVGCSCCCERLCPSSLDAFGGPAQDGDSEAQSGDKSSHNQKPKTRKDRIFVWLVLHMRPCRHAIFFMSALAGVLMVIIAFSSAEADTSGFPNIFPKDHNQNKGQEVFPDQDFDAPPATEEVCPEHSIQATSLALGATACSLFWCEVEPNVVVGDSTCRCWRKEFFDAQSQTTVASAVQRVVGLSSLSQAEAAEAFGASLVDGQSSGLTAPAGGIGSAMLTPVSMTPILLQEWFEGTVALDPMWDLVSILNRVPAATSPVVVEDICYCNTSVCRKPDGETWRELSTIPYPPAGRRLYIADSELLYRSDLRPLINVVMGIEVTAGTPILGEREDLDKWSFLSTFEAAQPWAQRNMLSFCEDFTEELRVVGLPSARCWIEEFRDYVMSSASPLDVDERRFPVPLNRYNELITSFKDRLSPHYGAPYKDYLWLRDDGDGYDMVKASIYKFNVDISENIDVDLGMDYMALWDNYLNNFNAQAVRYTRGAFHTSDLWVRIEAQRQLVESTILTIVIVLVLAFCGMLLFTCNAILSALVVVCTLQVIFGLAFFITVIMKWPIGPVEVIALIVFIGYAVTYSLHIAHKFGSHEALSEGVTGFLEIRTNRVTFALQRLGTAAIGSAATTFGCSAFLLGCQLTIFNKLGGVVMAVTVMSVLTALGTLPAVLMVIGPTHKGCIGVRCTRQDYLERKQRLSDRSRRASQRFSRTSYAIQEEQPHGIHDASVRSGTPQSSADPRNNPADDATRLTPVTAVSAGGHSPSGYARYMMDMDDPAPPVPSDRMSGLEIGLEAPLGKVQTNQVHLPSSQSPNRSPRAVNKGGNGRRHQPLNAL